MSKPGFLLRHLRFRNLVKFSFPQRLQDQLAREFLDHKASVSAAISSFPLPPAPTPTIITFTPQPVYTTGRREHGNLSEEQLGLLKAPLWSSGANPIADPVPEVWPTQRGGQTTFHGPGQVVIYPVLDLRSSYPLWPKGLSPRCYVNLLEQTTINTLARWGLTGVRTENPGVWEEKGERKIAALGVHLRRNITSYGVGLNAYTDLRYFDRIVACGLVDKKVTSMTELAMEKGISENELWDGAKSEGDAPHTTTQAVEEGEVLLVEGDEADKSATNPILHKEQQYLDQIQQSKLNWVADAWVREFMKGLFGEDSMNRVDHRGAWKECESRGIN